MLYFAIRMKLYTTAIFSLFIVAMACQNDMPRRKMLNPNGDSELAVLMRDMFDEGMSVKQKLIRGEKPLLQVQYHQIHTATPTEAGKNSSTEYRLFAEAYEASVERFRNASGSDQVLAYQNMVDNCMSCHRSVCPGPTVRIKKMYLSEMELELIDDHYESPSESVQ